VLRQIFVPRLTSPVAKNDSGHRRTPRRAEQIICRHGQLRGKFERMTRRNHVEELMRQQDETDRQCLQAILEEHQHNMLALAWTIHELRDNFERLGRAIGPGAWRQRPNHVVALWATQ
jgi:hypothetical protein